MQFTRVWLKKHKAELDKEDAITLSRLAEDKRCQHRVIVDNGLHYVYCGGTVNSQEVATLTPQGEWLCKEHIQWRSPMKHVDDPSDVPEGHHYAVFWYNHEITKTTRCVHWVGQKADLEEMLEGLYQFKPERTDILVLEVNGKMNIPSLRYKELI